MSRILILDDNPQRHLTFTVQYMGHERFHVHTAEEAIAVLKHEPKFDVIQLDHDLGGEEMIASGPGTGYEVVNFICEMDKDSIPDKIIIHSYNHPAVLRMQAKFREYGIESVYEPAAAHRPATHQTG